MAFYYLDGRCVDEVALKASVTAVSNSFHVFEDQYQYPTLPVITENVSSEFDTLNVTWRLENSAGDSVSSWSGGNIRIYECDPPGNLFTDPVQGMLFVWMICVACLPLLIPGFIVQCVRRLAWSK